MRAHELEHGAVSEFRQSSVNDRGSHYRSGSTILRKGAAYVWDGPSSLPQELQMEWRFVAIRWIGILIVAPSLPLVGLDSRALLSAYAVLIVATLYNLTLQVLLVRGASLLANGYVTTISDGFLDIAIVVVAGGFDSPLYYILYTVTIAAAMRYGYGPVLAMAVLFVSSDFIESAFFQHSVDAPFIFRSAFLLLTAVLAGYLHEQTKKAEAALQERLHQANALNKELEAFSYSVSHDLRAPLRSIDGFSQALLEDYSGSLDDEGQDYLHRVRAASVRMAQLIDDLLDLSRVTRSEIRRKTVNLSALAESIIAELKETEPDRQARVVIAPNVLAYGDAQLLHVVLENLLGNAWKFTATRARARIEFGTTVVDGKTAYFVRDNGVGFDMAYTDKLFGAFQRLHSMIEFEGNGIGLATVQRIVHRHGGRVWGEGLEGKGATFYFSL